MDAEYLQSVADRFGPRLRELRGRAGLSQAALAARANVRQATIAEYETGRYPPSWPNALRLAAALGVDVAAFTVAADDSGKNSGIRETK